MSRDNNEVNDSTIQRIFAKHLGINEDYFKSPYRNVNNAEILTEMEHNDIEGAESKIFATCFQ